MSFDYVIATACTQTITVVATTYHNNKWPHKVVNLLGWNIKWGIHKRTRQGASSQLVSYLYKNSWSVLPIINLPSCLCFILIPALYPTQGHHMYSICSDVIFQTLSSCSRLVTSNHVTCHVNSLSCASSLLFKKKKKKKSKIKK